VRRQISIPAPTWPLLRGLLPFHRNRLVPDVVAGITLAALGIPEVMGYTKIAGTPLVTGLYTLLLPIVAFAVLGGSRHLVVAADSATAGLLVYRFEADLFYANANLFMQQILHLVSATEQPIRAVVLDASGIDNIDYTAAKMLLELRNELARRNIAFSTVATFEGVRDDLQRYGLADDHAYATVDAALTALRQT